MKEEAEKRSCIKEIRKNASEDKRRRSLTQKHAASNKMGPVVFVGNDSFQSVRGTCGSLFVLGH